MAKKPLPTPEVLRQLLDYDPDSGTLIWRPRPQKFFRSVGSFNAWNAKFAGTIALNCTNPDGYKYGNILKSTVKAHRVAWAIAHGAWPDGFLDHINGVRSDNRLCNLRLATNSQNMANAKSRTGSTSRFLGVHLNRKNGKYVAQITSGGKVRHLGNFDTELSAAAAYDAAAVVVHGIFARRNFSH